MVYAQIVLRARTPPPRNKHDAKHAKRANTTPPQDNPPAPGAVMSTAPRANNPLVVEVVTATRALTARQISTKKWRGLPAVIGALISVKKVRIWQIMLIGSAMYSLEILDTYNLMNMI